MNLFFFDHIIQLDSLAPLIDLIAKEKKRVLIINTNPTSLYKKNKLLKFFKDQNIQILNNPPLNIKNNMKLFLIKIITLLPKIFVQRLQGFWWRVSNDNFFDDKNFEILLNNNNVRNIFIPNDYTNKKKFFLNKFRKKKISKLLKLKLVPEHSLLTHIKRTVSLYPLVIFIFAQEK